MPFYKNNIKERCQEEKNLLASFFLCTCMDVINPVNPYGKNVRKDRRQKDV